MDGNAVLLPIAQLYGKEYLVDIEKRQFRNFNNSEDVVEMHSMKGRQMVNDMQGMDWNCTGISSGSRKGLEA